MRRRLFKILLLCFVILALIGVGTLLVLERVRSLDQRTAAPLSGVQTQPAGEVKSLRREKIIQGYACARGWVHFYPDGTLHRFTSLEPIPLGQDTIPPGTWVTLDRNGVLVRCNFPTDTVIQGQLCRGTGGSKGVGTSFHPNGALASFFPPADTSIQGVNCAGGVLDQSVVLYGSGKLHEAILSQDTVLDGRQCRKGDRVVWDPAGQVVSVTRATWTERGLRKIFDWLS